METITKQEECNEARHNTSLLWVPAKNVLHPCPNQTKSVHPFHLKEQICVPKRPRHISPPLELMEKQF